MNRKIVPAKKGEDKPFFPVDKDGNIIPGTYETSVGTVKLKKIERAKHNDVLSLARAMNDNFGQKSKELFQPEINAAYEAIKSGIYVSWRPIDPPFDRQDCQRVSSEARCFCGHQLNQHDPLTKHEAIVRCAQPNCACRRFQFVPSRPEDFGEFWLPKRRDYVASEYRTKCQCKHTHEEHVSYPAPHRCDVRGCSCNAFTSASVCAACDLKWERHQTVIETEKERRADGRQVGEDWLPFSELPSLRDIVLTGVDNPAIEQLSDAIPAHLRNQLNYGQGGGGSSNAVQSISNMSPYPYQPVYKKDDQNQPRNSRGL